MAFTSVSRPFKVKPRVWGLHDYKDLELVGKPKEERNEALGSYANKEAKDFARQIKTSRLKAEHIWLTEQGVLLQNGSAETRVYGHPERQRLAAQDFLRLGRSSEHFEWMNYYLYEGPTEAALSQPHHEHEFDSALLHGEGVHEEQEPREAYCVLALGDSAGCPARGVTGASVSATTTSSTVLLDVYPDGLPTKYLVEYGTTTAYGYTTTSAEVSNEVGGQSETASLSGLEPCTTYHYQAEAENEANEDVPSLGGDQTVTTRGCPPTVETLGFSYNGEDEMVLHGEVNPNGSPTTYHFEWGYSEEYETAPEEAGNGIRSIEVTADVNTYAAEHGGRGGMDFMVHPDYYFCTEPWYSRIVATNEFGTSYGRSSRSWECF